MPSIGGFGGGAAGGGLGGGGFGGGGGLFSVPSSGQFGRGSGGGVPAGLAPAAGATVEEALIQPDGSVQMEVKHNLVSLVMEMTSPPCHWMDTDGPGGAIRAVGNSLVVRQTLEGHREIVKLLNLLSEQ